MPVSRRTVLQIAASAATAMALPAVRAQGTDRPLRILVGFAPGGATDVVARTIAEPLGRLLGRAVIVDNRPGAGGMVATRLVKDAAPDGTTVMLTIDHAQVIIPLTYKQPGYDPAVDFTPLAGVANYYNALVVSNSVGVKDFQGYAAWLKANPSQGNYGVGAAGSVAQFSGQLIGSALGVHMEPVAYKGGAPLVQELIGGQIPAGIVSLTDALEHHRAGKLRILAVSGASRSKVEPTVPTFSELGLKGLEVNPWLAFFGPKGLPPAMVDAFSTSVARILQQKDTTERLASIGNEVLYASPEQLQREWVTAAARHWAPVVKASGWVLQ
ncbi:MULTISPECIES: Bug family tripartite tricarboxylate transporter substrate binding protein [unclassified Variovorax]|uniref:Bug family tripartite tricarboxylate transporter substrate binding protein n=1 Tax=unclassified Variovorax TaxID=663243 RepID=UPI0025788D35|nr:MULTISPECIES: Bug family tripartite tricarboxylate transporter substrate binding protein [unclassified Variovorax]MDM0090006.1 Bug family tripartite tricarboxylate transporter substrate binding protein [Variovorax sp. J22G40]MDM0148328.1 Bug family tripartite tricarboxylate transporter substrate binding protein [Variovorax sp. J2P1-31]